MKISAIVVTKNEAANIARCLTSLSIIADEIIVVDAYSQDATAQICESFPKVHFISCPWIGLEGMKRLGKKVAQYDHILHIAADEVLSPELQHNLWSIKQNTNDETVAMVNYIGKPCVALESQSESANKTDPTYYLSRQTTYERYPSNKKNTSRRKPQLVEVW